MEPYDLSSLEITVTSVIGDAGGNPVVAWSDALNTQAHPAGSAFALPDGLLLTGGSVVVTEVRYNYSSTVATLWTNGFPITDTFYQRPRRVMQIIRHS
jgi:hypothetical protein